MTAGISQAPTALDDAIIRNAEATLETVGRARDAIHSVIFGQEQVVDLTLSRFWRAATVFSSACRGWRRRSLWKPSESFSASTLAACSSPRT